jgi:DGQHR domain-containing protein
VRLGFFDDCGRVDGRVKKHVSGSWSPKRNSDGMARKRLVRRRALRIEQNPQRPLYVFSLAGEEVLRIADISRVQRSEQGRLLGYQRAEVRRHIRNITEYLDSPDVLLPNALVLALSPEVRFRGMRGPRGVDDHTVVGTIEIPVPRNGGPRPAWIVDGQQRALALARCRRKDFPVVVNAFVADRIDVQREQFLRVNSTKPLPRGLITELLPEIDTVLPPSLAARRVPSAMCDLLNQDRGSPFRGLIRRSSSSATKNGGAARERGVVADTAIVQMVQESLSHPKGILFIYRNVSTGAVDVEGIRRVLLTYWNAVREEFPDAWGLPPTKSRLMHGAGIRAMGRLMDRVMAAIDPSHAKATGVVRLELGRVRPICRWTGGVWDRVNGLRWNEIQNVPSHIRMLSDALVRAYLMARA